MSRRAPRPFSLAIEDLRGRLQPAGELAAVQTAWSAVAGEALDGAATPTSLRGGVLTLECESSVWAQEIQLMGDELVAGLAAALPETPVEKVRCVVNAR